MSVTTTTQATHFLSVTMYYKEQLRLGMTPKRSLPSVLIMTNPVPLTKTIQNTNVV